MHDAGDRNHRIILTQRLSGTAEGAEPFGMDTTAVPTPGPGQFLSRTVYLALDSALLGLNPGDVVGGEAVAQVLESRHPDYRSGEFVVVRNGWQQFALSSGQGVRRLDPQRAPISTALGVLGLPGLAGYVGLVYMGEPRPGQTVLVSSATGAVGCTVGQVARQIGARAVGIAGTTEKCQYAVSQLGFAACINRNAGDLAAEIRAACPEGIDVYFDVSGRDASSGVTLQAATGVLASHARIVLCDINDRFSGGSLALAPIVKSRATVRGIQVQDHLHRLPELERVVGGWIRAGVFGYKEDITEGLANAPGAFARSVRGEHFGNVLARVAPEHL